MTFGSLFAGIGGFDLGLERTGMECKWQVEIDDYCNQVLAKHWPKVKRYRDVKEVGRHNLEPVDLICGGFPCQPFSVAGKQRGKEDDRHLWPEMLRVIKEVGPTWVIAENVPGLIPMGLDDVLSDLEAEGYVTRTFNIPACGAGAYHRRERLWIVGYSEHYGSSGQAGPRSITATHAGPKRANTTRQPTGASRSRDSKNVGNPKSERCGEARPDSQRPEKRSAGAGVMADSEHGRRNAGPTPTGRQEGVASDRLCRSGRGPNVSDSTPIHAQGQQNRQGQIESRRSGGRQTQSGLGREAHGVRGWLDGTWEDEIPRVTTKTENRAKRLKALGNAVVPQISEILGRMIMEIESTSAEGS